MKALLIFMLVAVGGLRAEHPRVLTEEVSVSVARTNSGLQITLRNGSKAPVRYTAFNGEPDCSADVLRAGKWTAAFFLPRCGMGIVERELPAAKSVVCAMPYYLISTATPGDRVRIRVHVKSPVARPIFSNEIVITQADMGDISLPVMFKIPPAKG